MLYNSFCTTNQFVAELDRVYVRFKQAKCIAWMKGEELTLATCSKGLLENLTVPQLVNEFPVFH